MTERNLTMSMLGNDIIRNSHAVSQLFQFLAVFGIDRFTVLRIENDLICASVGWPDDGRHDYDPSEEVQDVSWKIDRDPSLDPALLLLHLLSKNNHIDVDKITASEVEIEEISSHLKLDWKSTLDKLLSIRVNMVDEGKKTDFFFLHL